MAKQIGPYSITGTVDNLCFYKMEGKFYVRSKSSLSGKRVKKDPVFKQTMFYAGLLSAASTIASGIYKQILADDKVKGLYRRITGEAMQLLKAGNNKAAVELQLQASYLAKPEEKVPKPVKVVAVLPGLFTSLLLQTIFTDRMPETEMVVTKNYFCNSS